SKPIHLPPTHFAFLEEGVFLAKMINNDISVTFLAGDRISLKVTTGGANATTDTVAQVEIF
ncbi:hypothetical protein CN678_16780, partial [Bacillus toyonensis]